VVPYVGELDRLPRQISHPAPRRGQYHHDRRRKGTLALLEDIARDAAGGRPQQWSSFRHVAWTQNINHLHPHRGRNDRPPPRRRVCAVDGPFDESPTPSMVRRPNSTLMPGRVRRSFGRSVRLAPAGLLRDALRADAREDMGPHC